MFLGRPGDSNIGDLMCPEGALTSILTTAFTIGLLQQMLAQALDIAKRLLYLDLLLRTSFVAAFLVLTLCIFPILSMAVQRLIS